MKDTYVLYHGDDCLDGFGAAFAAWLSLGNRADYIPVRYGEAPPELPAGAALFIVDFAYPRETLLRLAERHPHVLVIDHHETPTAGMTDLPFVVYNKEEPWAMLAWENWHSGKWTALLLISYIQDRDLWQWRLPHSREINTALRYAPRDFRAWESLSISQLQQDGVVLMRMVHEQVCRIADAAKLCDVGVGEDVTMMYVVNAPVLTSEACEELLRRGAPMDVHLVAAYRDELDRGWREWSLRSVEPVRADLIARRLGGGGRWWCDAAPAPGRVLAVSGRHGSRVGATRCL